VRKTPTLLVAAAMLAPASTADASFIVSGADPAGDTTGASPARDIVRVGFSYNRVTGEMRGGVALAGSPTAESAANLTLFAGTSTDTGCNAYPAVGFATQTDLTGAQWVRLTQPGGAAADSGGATKVYDEVAEEYSTRVKALGGERPDCVVAQLNEPGNSANVYDVAGPFALQRLPELEATFGKVSFLRAGGKAKRFRITLRNVGDAPSGRVKLAMKRQRGLDVGLPRSIAPLKAGERRRIRVTVSASRRARSNTPLRFSATGTRGIRATADSSVLVTSGSSGGGRGGDGGSKLCYRYTWLPPYSTLVPC
jgi:hypothetical protein